MILITVDEMRAHMEFFFRSFSTDFVSNCFMPINKATEHLAH